MQIVWSLRRQSFWLIWKLTTVWTHFIQLNVSHSAVDEWKFDDCMFDGINLSQSSVRHMCRCEIIECSVLSSYRARKMGLVALEWFAWSRVARSRHIVHVYRSDALSTMHDMRLELCSPPPRMVFTLELAISLCLRLLIWDLIVCVHTRYFRHTREVLASKFATEYSWKSRAAWLRRSQLS